MGNKESQPTRRGKRNDQEQYRDEYLWKIVVIGETGAGKTSIVKRLINQTFSINYDPTNQVQFFLKQIKWDANTMIRAQIWDISGNERYGKLTRSLYKGALGAVVVIDLTKYSTLKEAATWAADIKSKIAIPPNVKFPMILLGTKADLLRDEDKTKIRNKLEVIAKRNEFIGWWLVSSKDNHNISRPFDVLTQRICKLQARWPAVLEAKVLPARIEEYTPLFGEEDDFYQTPKPERVEEPTQVDTEPNNTETNGYDHLVDNEKQIESETVHSSAPQDILFSGDTEDDLDFINEVYNTATATIQDESDNYSDSATMNNNGQSDANNNDSNTDSITTSYFNNEEDLTFQTTKEDDILTSTSTATKFSSTSSLAEKEPSTFARQSSLASRNNDLLSFESSLFGGSQQSSSRGLFDDSDDDSPLFS